PVLVAESRGGTDLGRPDYEIRLDRETIISPVKTQDWNVPAEGNWKAEYKDRWYIATNRSTHTFSSWRQAIKEKPPAMDAQSFYDGVRAILGPVENRISDKELAEILSPRLPSGTGDPSDIVQNLKRAAQIFAGGNPNDGMTIYRPRNMEIQPT